jgi:hypothetical protein
MQLRHLLLSGLIIVLTLSAVACGGGGSSGSKTVEKLFSTQAEELDVYDLQTGAKTVLIGADGWVNGQICQVPDGSGDLLMAEDKDEEKGVRSGWSIFAKDGTFKRKLTEPRSATNESPTLDPAGCAFDRDKRLFTADVGAEDFNASSGKLILFFPPDYNTSCILNDTLRTAGSVAADADDGSVLVSEAVPPGDVLRFSPPFPKSADDCGKTLPEKSTFIKDPDFGTPRGIVRAGNGNWYVSSVFIPTGINEYDKSGTFVRKIASGQDIGNPEGLALASDGTIYYADLGLIQTQDRPLPHPGPSMGTVRKVTFNAQGDPQQPVIIGSKLGFPDGVAVLKVQE